MNGICDWPGCTSTDTIGYKVDRARPREMCPDHLEAFLDLKDRRGPEVAWRKLDSWRRKDDSD